MAHMSFTSLFLVFSSMLPFILDEAAGAGHHAVCELEGEATLKPAAHAALPPAREGGHGSSGARARSAG